MIKNYNLELFLSNYFGKNIKEINEDDMNSLTEISFDGLNIDNEYEKINFYEMLKMFPSLRKIVVNNYVFSKDDIEFLNNDNIIEYSFYKCDFKSIKNINLFNHAEILMFEKCAFRDYSFLNDEYLNLEVFYLSNPCDDGEIDLLNVNTLNIKELYLERCNVKNFKAISKFIDLEYINIFDSEITVEELACFINLNNLDTLFVSQEYIDDQIIDLLNKNNINVVYNINDLCEKD